MGYTTGEGNSSFIYNSMDVTSDSLIYSGNMYVYTDFPGQEYLTLAKLDKELNKIWQMGFVVLGKNHNVVGIKALSNDEGFVIYGVRYVVGTEINPSEYVPFVIKFGPDGGLSWTKDAPSEFYTIKTYPNPSTGQLTIDLQDLNTEVDIRVFDMTGRNVFVQNGVIGETTLNLSALSDGTYVYKIYQSGREMSSGKWIKVR